MSVIDTNLPKPTLIDLFAGCGGVTQGFKNAGFEPIVAVEWDDKAAKTYRLNHDSPNLKLYTENIRDLSPSQVMKDCGLNRGDLTVLSVCAPCQPFSRQNRNPQKKEQAKLVLEMKRFVQELQPQFAIMENVPDLAKGQNRQYLDEVIAYLRHELNYRVLEPQVIDAVNYGVPQFRKRLILLCSRDNIDLTIPPSTHAKPKLNQMGLRPWQTVGDAFIPLSRSRLASGQRSPLYDWHKAPKHSEKVINRLKHIRPNGGSRKDLPKELELPCHRKGTGFNDVYGRMDKRKPANTLTTGCTNLSKGRFAHPTANRSITPREAACLQTFPIDYRFCGSYTSVSTQIGNAVPVKLAEVLANHLYKLWRDNLVS
ncbi:DNA cytosine methyltransferase [Anaerolineales bacterium HSG24]|nr:DNA cytosine methyltransferase [Anaerolineales bacterium HSG24]